MTVPAPYRPPDLHGRVALVAGATRGTGRGIALALGEAGATVYCTGRSTRTRRRAKGGKKTSPFDLARRPETIEKNAGMGAARGGEGGAGVVGDRNANTGAKVVGRVR